MIPRFSITGLMLFTLGVAGGVSASLVVKTPAMTFFGLESVSTSIVDRAAAALWCSLMIWVAIGLLFQAWDLRSYLRDDGSQPADIRKSLSFDAGWRLCVAVSMPLTYLFESWGRTIVQLKGEATPWALFLYPEHFAFLRWFLLMIAIGVGGGYRAGPSACSRLSQWLGGLACVAGGCLTLIIVFESGILFMLIVFALNGVEAHHPLTWKRAPVGRELIEIEAQWFTISLVQITCALFSLATMAILLARDRRTRRRWDWLLVSLTIAFAVASIAIQTQFRLVALPQMSPSFAEVLPVIPPLANLMIALAAILHVAARASYSRGEWMAADWRTHPERYLQERRPILGLAFFVAVLQVIHELMLLQDFQSYFPFVILRGLLRLANDFLTTPENYWPLAMLLLAGQRFVAASRDRDKPFITYGLSFQRLVANSLLFGLVAIAVVCAVGTWSIAAWIPLGWAR